MNETLKTIKDELLKIDAELALLEQQYIKTIDNEVQNNDIATKMIRIRKQKQELLDLQREARMLQANKAVETKETITASPIKRNVNQIILDVMSYDGKTNAWTFDYHINGNDKTATIYVSPEEIASTKKQFKKSKALKGVDINKYLALKKFDEQYHTKYQESYLRNNESYITKYNLRKIFKNTYYSTKEKISTIWSSNIQRRRNNAEVLNPKMSAAIPATLGVAIVLSLAGGVSKANTSDNNKAYAQVSVEQPQNETQDSSKVYTTNVVIENNETENVAQNNQTETIQESYSLKVSDKFELDNVKLGYEALNDTISVITDQLSCSYYKISYICVMSGPETLDLQYASNLSDIELAELVKSYKENFGEDIQIYVNYNGFDENDNQTYTKIGWTELSQVKLKNTTANQDKTASLNEIKNNLVSSNYTKPLTLTKNIKGC